MTAVRAEADTSQRGFTIALCGIPNSGKTSVFNSLTGLNYKVANYPGVTVERKAGKCKFIPGATVIDLPGTYSLFGSSPDEQISGEYFLGLLKEEVSPDVVVCVVDACNLERNLFLTSQLIDIGYPVIVGLTMSDVAEKEGIKVYRELLSRTLGVPVVDVSGRSKKDLRDLILTVEKIQRNDVSLPNPYSWCTDDSFLAASRELGESYIRNQSQDIEIKAPTMLGVGVLCGAKQCKHSEAAGLITKTREMLRVKGIEPGTFESDKRYEWIRSIIEKTSSYVSPKRKKLANQVDKILTHKLWGSIVFLLIMGTMFQSIFTWASIPMDLLDGVFATLQTFAKKIIPASQFQSLVADGVVAGVGAVLIFVPQIAILYLFISVLEESGYLSRAACLLDKLLRRFGLQGRSFIPLLSSFACAVPGIMSARSIPSLADRMTTIMIAPLMSCSARLPVYTLLIAAFIPHTTVAGVFNLQGLVMLSMYLLGILGAVAVAFILKRTVLAGEPAHFIMEIPPYRVPRVTLVLRTIWDKVWIFVKNAGTIILAASIVLWFLASYPRVENVTPAQALEASYAGKIGKTIEPVIEPLGFDWKIGVGLFASFAAREVFVSSMALVYNLEDADEESDSLIDALQNARDPTTNLPAYTLITALSLMVFYVFACQCISTLAICKRETGNWRWPALMFIYMTVLAYLASLITYQIGSLLI